MEVVSFLPRRVLLCLKFVTYGQVSFAFTGNWTIDQVTLFFFSKEEVPPPPPPPKKKKGKVKKEISQNICKIKQL